MATSKWLAFCCHWLLDIIRVPNQTEQVKFKSKMNAAKLEHFKQLLLSELRRHAENIDEDQMQALEVANDDAKESSDLALRDVIQELALKLGDRESQMVADIDQALMRMGEGSYGICIRCNQPIDERRLEAMPTARYDAACQAAIEAMKGQTAGPSL